MINAQYKHDDEDIAKCDDKGNIMEALKKGSATVVVDDSVIKFTTCERVTAYFMQKYTCLQCFSQRLKNAINSINVGKAKVKDEFNIKSLFDMKK